MLRAPSEPRPCGAVARRPALVCTLRTPSHPRLPIVCHQSGTQPAEQEGLAASAQQQQTAPAAAPAPAQTFDPSSTAVYPGYPGYAYQAMPQASRPAQEYYMAPPPAYYPPPPPQYKAPEASSGAPWWIWVGVGVVAANIFNKVTEFMRNPKTPQQMMAEMAMKQMMNSMGGSQAGSPFGKAGMPPFPPGFPTPPSSATVDVPSSSTPSTSSERRGEKFESRIGSTQGGSATGAVNGAPGSSGSSSSGSGSSGDASSSKDGAAKAPAAAATGSVDVVDPIVKEPPSSSGGSSSSSSTRGRSASSFFADASAQDAKTSSSASGSSSSSGSSGGGNGAGSGGDPSGVMSQMMETMLRNPDMQKMLYPYLPEPMRNPQSIEWMLTNPEVKKQMAQMFESQNMMSPEMMEMMRSMDFSQDKVNRQFQQLGLKPEDVFTKVMSNPELAAGFSNPKVQAAILDISSNPVNIVKYQSDPEIMKVLEQVTSLFQGDVQASQQR